MSEGYKILPESTGGNVRVTSMWVNSVNVLQQGVSIADATSGWQLQINSAGGALTEVQNVGLVSSLYAELQAKADATETQGVSDPIELSGNTGATLSLSTIAAHTNQLASGIYDVKSDVDAFIKVGATANDVTTSNGYPLIAGNVVPVRVPANERIGGILESGSGTLRYHKVGT